MPVTIRGIKFENNTCWHDADLWGFLRPLVIAELEKPKWAGLKVTFQARRNQRRVAWRASVRWCGASGHAYWGWDRSIVINVPTVFESLNEREKIDLASTIAHELWHINARRGGHAVEVSLRKSVKYGRPKTEDGQAKQAEFYAWAAALPLRKRAAVTASANAEAATAEPEPQAHALAATVAGPRTLILDRAAKAAAALARWEAELVRREKAVKRAKRKVSAARRKAAYYAKKTGVS